ncbi:hypothetical protein JCM6882_005149 [Rhodosporidiobolus microsporus]
MSSPPSSISLPLSSLLASHTPSHPLPKLLTAPLLPRLAFLEARLLLARPSSFLLRTGLASEAGLVSLAVAALVAALVRWRGQWRAVLWALGVGEALGRTVKALRREGGGNLGKGRAVDSEGASDDDHERAQETQHILSWWLLFALLSLLDALRISPTSSPPSPSSSSLSSLLSLPAHLRTTLHSLRHTYLRFLRLYVLPPLLRLRHASRAVAQRYPSLDVSPHLARLPSLALPALLQRRASAPPPRVRASFPQPRLHSALPSSARSIPLSWSYLASSTLLSPSSSSTPSDLAAAVASAEKRWELVKLLVLWVGLRRDAWGARSVVWEWVVEPLLGGAVTEGAGEEGGVEVRAFRRNGKREDGKEVVAPEESSRAASQDPPPDSRRSSSEHPPYQSDFLSFSPPLSSSTTATSFLPPSASTSSSWTPRPAPSPSSVATTPRRPRSTNRTRSPSPTPSTAPFAFPTPPPAATAPRGFSHTRPQHPLIPLSLSLPPARIASASPASSNGTARWRGRPSSSSGAALTSTSTSRLNGSAPRVGGEGRDDKRASLLFESPPKRPGGLHGGGGSSSSSSAHEDDAEEDHEGLPPPPQTPGEEEAEEGLRGWGSVVALGGGGGGSRRGSELEDVGSLMDEMGMGMGGSSEEE